MNISGILSGISFLVIGLVFLIISFGSKDFVGKMVLIFWGLISIGLGIYILFNLENEDKIESIRERVK